MINLSAEFLKIKTYSTHEAFKLWKNSAGENSYDILAKYSFKRSGSLVDLGSGRSELLSYIRKNFAGKYTGIDQSQREIDIANTIDDNHAEFICSSTESIPLASETASTAISHMFFHMLIDPKPTIKETARILKNGGELIFLIRNPSPPSGVHSEIAKYIRSEIESTRPDLFKIFLQHRPMNEERVSNIFKVSFSTVETKNIELHRFITPEEGFNMWNGMFPLTQLTEKEKRPIAQKILNILDKKSDINGQINYSTYFSLYRLKKL